MRKILLVLSALLAVSAAGRLAAPRIFQDPQKRQNAFERAVHDGNRTAARKLRAAGARPDLLPRAERLGWAVWEGDVEAVRSAVDSGADLNGGALGEAARLGHGEVMKLLLDRGADANLIWRGNAPLAVVIGAGRWDLVPLLLEHKADPNCWGIYPARPGQRRAPKPEELRKGEWMSGSGGEMTVYRTSNPLSEAVRKGDPTLVRLLLAAGADPTRKQIDIDSAIAVAAETGRQEIVAVLTGGRRPPKNDEATEKLIYAAYGLKEDVVRALLAAGADPNVKKNNVNPTLLAVAANRRALGVVRALLEAGADPNASFGLEKRTALMYACAMPAPNLYTDGNDYQKRYNEYYERKPPTGPDPVQREIVETLLEAGARPDDRDDKKRTALFSAATEGPEEAVDALLKGGADVNCRDEIGQTPLMFAASRGDRKIVERLLAAGADPAAEAENGMNPVIMAGQRDHADVVELLRSRRSPRPMETPTPFPAEGRLREIHKDYQVHARAPRPPIPDGLVAEIFEDVEIGDLGGVRKCLGAGATGDLFHDGESLLAAAARMNRLDIAQLLIDSGAPVNQRDYSPLHAAAGLGHAAMVRLLLAHGADPNARDSQQNTPLHGVESPEVARELLAAGADPNARGLQGGTPLSEAAARPDVLAVFFEKGAKVRLDPNAGVNPGGETPLMRLARTGDVSGVRALLSAGAAVDARDAKGRTALAGAADAGRADVVPLLLAAGANVNARDADERTPVHLAAAAGAAVALRALCRAHPDLEAKDAKGFTPLMLAATDGPCHLPTRDEAAPVSALLEGGARTETRDPSGRTALSRAASSGKDKAVERLLAAKAAIDAADDSGNTVLMYAIRGDREACGYPEYRGTITLLIQRGARLDLRNREGKTAIDLAKDKSNPSLVDELTRAAGPHRVSVVPGSYHVVR